MRYWSKLIFYQTRICLFFSPHGAKTCHKKLIFLNFKKFVLPFLSHLAQSAQYSMVMVSIFLFNFFIHCRTISQFQVEKEHDGEVEYCMCTFLILKFNKIWYVVCITSNHDLNICIQKYIVHAVYSWCYIKMSILKHFLQFDWSTQPDSQDRMQQITKKDKNHKKEPHYKNL